MMARGSNYPLHLKSAAADKYFGRNKLPKRIAHSYACCFEHECAPTHEDKGCCQYRFRQRPLTLCPVCKKTKFRYGLWTGVLFVCSDVCAGRGDNAIIIDLERIERRLLAGLERGNRVRLQPSELQ